MRRLALAAVIAAVLVGPAVARDCGEGATATALLVDDLEVDGDLADWPPDLQAYEIGGRSPGRFRVVYSDETDLVYVGIEVQDDVHVVGRRWNQTDGVEVFTWGGDPTGDRPCEPRGGTRNPIQFAGVPGDGEYVPGCGNPCAKPGSSREHVDPRDKGARFGWSRHGDTTVYEWGLPVFADYEQGPIELAPRAIGFDIIVTDNDDGAYHWKAWGNPSGLKFDSPRHVATLVLSDERAPNRLWSWIADAVATLGGWVLYGAGAAALIGVGLVARGAVRGRAGTRERLASLERRITDTQDVLIALSEKYDRLEERLRQQAPEQGEGS